MMSFKLNLHAIGEDERSHDDGEIVGLLQVQGDYHSSRDHVIPRSVVLPMKGMAKK